MRSLLFSLIALLPFISMGQTDPMNQQIVTIGDRSIQLRDAFKINDFPTIFDTVQNAPNIRYDALNFDADLNYQVVPIKAAKLRIVEPLDKLNRFYVKAGVGNYLTPLAEVTFNSLRNRKSSYGFNGRFHRSNGGIKDVVNSSFSDIDFAPWYRGIGKASRFDVMPYFTRNTLHHYGYLNNDVDTVPNGDALQQQYQIYGGKVRLKSFHKDSTKINHDVQAEVRLMDDAFGAKELNVNTGLNLFSLYGKEYYQLGVGVDVNSLDSRDVDSTGAQRSSTIIHLSPSVETSGSIFKIKVGLRLFADAAGGMKFFFIPDLEANLNVLDGLMRPYFKLGGGVDRYGLFAASRANPYINSNLDLLNQRNKLVAELGIRGGISDRVSYHIGGFYRKQDQSAFFVADSTLLVRNRFNVIFDDMEVTGGRLELKYQNGERLKINLGGQYQTYIMESEAEAWYMPNLNVDFDVFYDIQDKFTVKLGANYVGERYGKILDGSALGYSISTLDPITDVNLGLEYRYTRKISAFLDVNNILGQRYFLFDQYPVMGINVMAGFTVSFL